MGGVFLENLLKLCVKGSRRNWPCFDVTWSRKKLLFLHWLWQGESPGFMNLVNLCEYPQVDGVTLNLFTHSLAKTSVTRQQVVCWLCVPGMGAWVRGNGPKGGTAPSQQQWCFPVAFPCPGRWLLLVGGWQESTVVQKSWYWYLLVPIVELGCWLYSASSPWRGVVALRWLGVHRHSRSCGGTSHLYRSRSSYVCQRCPKPGHSSMERFLNFISLFKYHTKIHTVSI